MTAKEAILGRIRGALRNAPGGEALTPGTYLRHDTGSQSQRVQTFIERVGEYGVRVVRSSEARLPEVILVACRAQNARRLVAPEGLPASWLPEGLEFLADSGLSHQDLDAADGVITTCALAIAQTGTLVLDSGPGQGRRALSLLPDYHLCIVQAGQVVGLVPEAITKLAGSASRGRPITFISGPSATSDIELSRVEGVHGPRRLEVLLVDRGLS